jgi:hypothetical protein
MGTQRQQEILQRTATGHALLGDIERLQDVGWTMTDASLCGLGQTAASAVLSAIKLWPELFVAASTAKRSPSKRGTGQPAKRAPRSAGTSASKTNSVTTRRSAPKTAAKPRSKPRPKRRGATSQRPTAAKKPRRSS